MGIGGPAQSCMNEDLRWTSGRGEIMMLNVWLIASGKHREELEEALRMSSLGHNLTVFGSGEECDRRARDLLQDAKGVPHIVMYLIGDNPAVALDWLAGMKKTREFRHIPVIVFHSEVTRSDVTGLYALGAASVIRVPVGFQGLAEIMRVTEAYWFSVVEVPQGGSHTRLSSY